MVFDGKQMALKWDEPAMANTVAGKACFWGCGYDQGDDLMLRQISNGENWI